MDLDCLRINFQSLFLVDKELLHGIALVALQLNHVAGLFIVDNCAVASELLLDDFEDLLQIEFGRNAFNGSQGLASIALLDTNMDIGLSLFLSGFACILILRIRKGIERLKVLNLCGHTTLGGGECAKCSELRKKLEFGCLEQS